jgi:hypothetical protein
MTDIAHVAGKPGDIHHVVNTLHSLHGAVGDAHAAVKKHTAQLDAHWRSTASGVAISALGVTAHRLSSAQHAVREAAIVLGAYAAQLTSLQQQHHAIADALATTTDPTMIATSTATLHGLREQAHAAAALATSQLHALAAPPTPVVASKNLDAVVATVLDGMVANHRISARTAHRAGHRIATMSDHTVHRVENALDAQGAHARAQTLRGLAANHSVGASIGSAHH